ncbi:SubName: Full=Uncharacterized protein {ECO:0000313/EMBL:CCA69812.1} [Serendipita indica DSM 11827]|nr:SubName: Full=Uncharacterized protein {ECO:0000313/EMBL:CCA69812.1} [Serendipita indica DSM 11827]
MSSTQADLLESIPFVRDITPLDLIDLPNNLFQSLPKPCNMKRSAASGGPIWPPVLTNVLCNGLLILHHKPHLVGKQGLEEHYNWLSAFIYRQTRGWDPAALARNTIEIKPSQPGEHQRGIIRNRKQISSKVQTIGEYLKDTHWAYVCQGPRPPKDVLPLTGPASSSSSSTALVSGRQRGSAVSSNTRRSNSTSTREHVQYPPQQSSPPRRHILPPQKAYSTDVGDFDLSHVSLEPSWLPPTPFSLPSTPSHSPFLYPSDVPDFEFVDARVFGYDPSSWPEFEEQFGSYTTYGRTPTTLEAYVARHQSSLPLPHHHEARLPGLELAELSLSVYFSVNARGAEADDKAGEVAVNPSLRAGKHVLATLQPASAHSPSPVSQGGFGIAARTILGGIQQNSMLKVYQVDLPLHFPHGLVDRRFLRQAAGSDIHVKGLVRLMGSPRNGAPVANLWKVTSTVYFTPGDFNGSPGSPESLAGYEEETPLRIEGGNVVIPSITNDFISRLWERIIIENDTVELTRYTIVQTIARCSPEAASPALAIIYSLRQAASPGEQAMVYTLSTESEGQASSPMEVENMRYPEQTPRARRRASLSPALPTRITGRRKPSLSHTASSVDEGRATPVSMTGYHPRPSARRTPSNSAPAPYPPSSPAGTVGPIRSSRSRGSVSHSTGASHPMRFPLTPQASPSNLRATHHQLLDPSASSTVQVGGLETTLNHHAPIGTSSSADIFALPSGDSAAYSGALDGLSASTSGYTSTDWSHLLHGAAAPMATTGSAAPSWQYATAPDMISHYPPQPSTTTYTTFHAHAPYDNTNADDHFYFIKGSRWD